MDSCFNCGILNCIDLALHGNTIGCVNWIPVSSINVETIKNCSFCDNTNPEFDPMNCVYDNMLTLETTEWDIYYDSFNHVSLTVNYCPICGRKL